MLLKKAGMVTVGVAATLVAAAPLASATECHDDGGHHRSSSDARGCSFLGGTGGGSSSGDAAGAAAISGAAAGGLGGNNVGNIADCSSFLNDNLNGNQVASNNHVAL